MAEERLGIILDAETEAASKAIRDFAKTVGVELNGAISVYEAFDKKIKETQAALKAASDPAAVAKLTAELKGLESGFARIKTGEFATGLGKAGKAAANATPALTNFGRVLQDAPFGIIGIANNIDPLIGSFQALQKSTGSTGGALKALFAGLAGPAGIAIGISAVTSALVAFGPQIKAFFAGNKEASAAAEAAAKAVEALDDAIAGFATTAQQAAGKELAGLDSLIRGINNVNLSQQQRIFYVDELQKKYPAYFGNLSNEEILAGKTADAYARLTSDIVKASKARAAQNVIDKLTAQQLANEEAELNRLVKVQQELRGLNAKAASENKKRAKDPLGFSIGAGVATEQINTTTKESIQLSDEFAAKQKALSAQISFYTKFVDDGAAATANFGVKQSKASKAVGDSTKALTNAQREGLNFLKEDLKIRAANIPFLKGTAEETNAIAAAAKALNEQKRQEQALSKLGAGLGPATIDPNRGFQAGKIAQDAKDAADATNAAAIAADNAALAYGYLSPAIDGVFNALTSNDPFKALLDGLKQFIIGLIKAVAQALILQALTAAFSGGGTAGAGFLGKIGGLLGFRANGGPVNGGGAYLVGESGPELFVPNTGGNVVPNMALAGGGTLTAQVSGNDLLFILNQAGNNRRSNFG